MRAFALWIMVLVLWSLFLVSCNRQSSLTTIQQQRSGDYVVSLLNETPSVKQHSRKLTLEFRNASTNEPASVTNVRVEASMRMAGMGPMLGNVSSVRQAGAGRHEFDVDLSMAGQWNFIVTFDPNRRVQFNVSAQ